jgi:WD40 repeat protein
MRLTIRAVEFSPSGRLLAYTSGYTLGFWERQDNHSWSQTTMIHVHPEAPESGFYAIVFSPVDEHLVATCGTDREVSLWAQSATTGNWTRAAVLKGTGASVFNVAFSPDGTVLAAGAEDGTITLWTKELKLGNMRWVQQPSRLTAHTGAVTCVAFSPHGNILASSSFDSTIRFWSRAGQSQAWTEIEMDYQLEHTNYVYTIAFSPLGNYLASGGVDAVVSLWS